MAFQKFLLISGLMLVTITISTADTSTDNTKNDTAVNLQYVIPLHYTVKIRLFLEDNILFGECSILINISVASNTIWMYSAPISIMRAILIDSDNETIYQISSFEIYGETILKLYFMKQLLYAVYPNVFTLKITYMRIIHRNDNNFFRYASLKQLGQKLIETDVVTMKARQLFPCWDDQATKSTFKITIKHHKNYTVLSNMPIQEKYIDNYPMMWTDFKSFLMSAQHVMVVITTTTTITNHIINNELLNNNTNVMIWCRESILDHIVEAQNIIATFVPYFKQKYLMELSKLDIIVLWNSSNNNVATLGLLLLREADIIYNEKSDLLIRKKEIAHMIVRQLAFIWCEDVLLWSKEGFVTFIGAYILDEVSKDNSMMNLMVLQAQQESFCYDRNVIYSKNNLLAPTYLKSFMIWRMIYHMFPDEFWIGIQKHKDKQHTYSSMIGADDLWTTMQNIATSKKNLKEIIESWITYSYYPVVSVIKTNSIFVITYNDLLNSFYDNVYIKFNIHIPITYVTQSSLNYKNTDKLIWLESFYRNNVTLEVDSSNLIIVNIQHTGYYRVHYDDENWNKLGLYLNSGNYAKIHILNRAQFIDDAFYFLLHRKLSKNIFWNLTNFLLQDMNFVTWYPMIKIFEYMACLFPLHYGKEAKEKMINIIDNLLTKKGYFFTSSDDSLTVSLKEEAAKWACILGIPECLRIAAEKLENELQNSSANNYLTKKKWIYCYGLKTARKTIWLMMWSRFIATNDDRYLEYLPCIEDSAVIREYLSLILEDTQFQRNKRAVEFLFTIAKHANKDEVLSYVFNLIETRHNSKSIHDVIATLIVVITNVHSIDHMRTINNFVTNYEERIVKAVKEKINKRKLEYKKQVQNYGYYFS